jgi:hypothetical protein
MTIGDIGKNALALLDDLNLSNFPGRPFDNSLSVFENQKARKTLIVMGLNGSMDDDGKTNKETIQEYISNPYYSNIENGLKYGWGGKRTLPRNLEKSAELLGSKITETIYTNAILVCSKNAETIDERAIEYGAANQHQLAKKSMTFHREFTFSIVKPEAILIYGNSLNSPSAANFVRQEFYTSDMRFLEGSSKNQYYWFETIIHGEKVPTFCVPHMSRVPPNLSLFDQFLRITEKFSE